MKKILVLTPPFLEPFRPPISGAIISEVASLAGFDVTAIDLSIEYYHEYGAEAFHNASREFIGIREPRENTLVDIDAFIKKFLPPEMLLKFEWILVSVFSKFEQGFAEIMLNYIRPFTDAKIVLGGAGVNVHKWTFADLTPFGKAMFNANLANYYVQGEGEIVLKELLSGNDTYPGINGKLPIQIQDIESLPLPNYDFYDMDKYDYLDNANKEIFIYGSRGCVKNCSFCDIAHFWPKYRFRTGKNIAEEMIRHYEKNGVTAVYFADSLFNGSLKNFNEMITTLANYGKVKWRWGGFAIIRPQNQHPTEMFDICAEAGMSNWLVGVEHASYRVRKELGKNITDDDIWYHLEQSERVGNVTNTILMLPTWPSETLEEHEYHARFFKKHQRFVASGAISSINISQSLFVFYDTPFVKERHFDWHMNAQVAEMVHDSYQNFWINKDNIELTPKERTRRILRLYDEAFKYKYPLNYADIRLHDVKVIIQNLIDNPALNSTENLIRVLDK